MSPDPDPTPPSASPAPLEATRRWLERAVIGLNLCPFAKAVHVKERIRWVLSPGDDPEALLALLQQELTLLAEADPERIDTTLIVHPRGLDDFLDFNDLVGVAETLLTAMDLDGVLQIASFHPRFQFADAEPDDIAHAAQRSPFPTLHLLREASIDRAVEAFPDAEAIVERNTETLRRLGPDGWARLMAD